MDIHIPDTFLEDFIGLWKYRKHGYSTQWCVTFCSQSWFYDTNYYSIPQDAVDEAYKQWQALRMPTDNLNEINVFKHTGKSA